MEKLTKFKKRERPTVSIIIPCWFTDGMHGKICDDETFIIAQECVKRLIDVTPKELYELIIIDNGSTATLEGVDEFWQQADVLIRNKENLGFAPAINEGVNIARGKYVIAVNNDILVWEGWLETMIKDWEENSEVHNPPFGVLMPAIVRENINFFDILKKKKSEIDMTKNAGAFGIKAEFGSLFMFKRELVNKIKKLNMAELGEDTFMDETFLVGFGEDRKLWRQVRMLKYETYRTHNLRIHHVGNLSMSKIKDRRQYTVPNRAYLEEWKEKNNIED